MELNKKLTDYLKRVKAQLPTENPNYNPFDARRENLQRRRGNNQIPFRQGGLRR